MRLKTFLSEKKRKAPNHLCCKRDATHSNFLFFEPISDKTCTRTLKHFEFTFC